MFREAFITFLLFFILSGIALSQPFQYHIPFNHADSIYLSGISEYIPPASRLSVKPALLPYKTDLTESVYFPPILTQHGWECHIAHGIYYNLAFEYNKLKGLPGNDPDNQLPASFILSFLNDGEYDNGANMFRAWEAAKYIGSANLTSVGEYGNDGYKRWLSGYQGYFEALHKQVDEYYFINVETESGLVQLKNWLYDHFGQDETGSLAHLLIASSGFTMDTLAQGTEEEGHLIVTAWGPWAGHSITIVGYNDSIRVDINEDGQYTNHIDINEDGIIDLKDWEIGALKIANSFGTEWGDEGFAYMMYRLLPLRASQGGPGINKAFVMEAKEYEPLLTMKLNMKHTSRNKLQVMLGVNTDTNASKPALIESYYIFNQQGGDYYLQGGEAEEDKYLETCLDITPLLQYIHSGAWAKYFVCISEADPMNEAEGEIISLSLLDYAGNQPQEIFYPNGMIPMLNHDTTYAGIVYQIDYEEVAITNASLDEAVLGEPYTAQLDASGGYPPYEWNIYHPYEQAISSITFPHIINEKLPLNNGYTSKTLDFEFPFFDTLVNTLSISVDGGIFIHQNNPLDFTAIHDNLLYLKNLQSIMAFFTEAAIDENNDESGIWFQGDENHAIIRWQNIPKDLPESALNFAVQLFPDGQIYFYYGQMILSDTLEWCAGISKGDQYNVHEIAIRKLQDLENNRSVSFTPSKYPVEFTLEKSGVFHGLPMSDTGSFNIIFSITDNKEIVKSKTLPLHISGPDSIVENDADETTLKQNIPNPFVKKTRINFTINQPGFAEMYILDINGKKQKCLVNETLLPDHYEVIWNGKNDTGQTLPPGVYICLLKMNGKTFTKKMIFTP